MEVASKEKRKENAKAESKIEASVPKPAMNLGETLFGTKPASSSTSANTFSSNSGMAAPSNPFSTSLSSASNNPFVAADLPTSELGAKSPQPSEPTDLPKTSSSALSLNNTSQFGPPPLPEPWPEDSEFPLAYPLYYLVDANYEILDKIEGPHIPTQTMDLDEDPGRSNQREDKDVYESTIDKTFQKFADRLAQNPE